MGEMADELEMQEYNLLHLPETHRRPLAWTTKDGTKIPVRDMKTSHIQNCLRLLKRAIENANYIDDTSFGLPDDIPTMSVVDPEDLATMESWVRVFEAELQNRWDIQRAKLSKKESF